jgi:hypothetical protein
LEHRTPKARYKRTSRKKYVDQIARIERRQARIKRIRDKLEVKLDGTTIEDVSRDPAAHHHIGKSQDNYVQLEPFFQKHVDDPAIKVRLFSVIHIPKLL